ncbi:MAG: hypothetical protein JWN76_362 [Chitinophagaceae bacterium]|nr:hypothetical protein [Chitinophagaceae bacterium]
MRKQIFLLLAYSVVCSCNYTTQNQELQAIIAKEDTARLNNMVQDMVTDIKQNMEVTGDPDIDFSRMMLLHHERVMEMANLVNMRTRDTLIKARTKRLTERLQQQDSIFVHYISNHEPDYNNDSFYIKSLNILNAIRKQSVVVSSKPIIDQGFLNLTSIQHKIAISIAKIYKQYTRDHVIDSIANTIIISERTVR